MQMFQGGFFIGPFIGSAVAGAWGFPAVYYLCAVFGFLAAAVCFRSFAAGGLQIAQLDRPEG
jgi:MFS family permease